MRAGELRGAGVARSSTERPRPLRTAPGIEVLALLVRLDNASCMTLPRLSRPRSVTVVCSVLALALWMPWRVAPRADARSASRSASVDDLERKASEIRRNYEELAAQVERVQQATLEKQVQIVATSGELMRRQEELVRKTAEFQHAVRLAYKYGPVDVAGVVLTARSWSELGLAQRYVGSSLRGQMRALHEMVDAHVQVLQLQEQLEAERGSLASELERLADALDRTAAALADTEAALAAAREELRIREEMARAMRILQSAGASERYSRRHRLATERQAEIYARYPFGPVSGIPPGLRPTGQVIEGIASWYGPGFNGLPTASGAIFDENLYTCANKELPLGTILLVTYQGRSVLVLVNDRGPFVPGRVLDLSRAAKDALGMGGLGYVTAQVLEPV